MVRINNNDNNIYLKTDSLSKVAAKDTIPNTIFAKDSVNKVNQTDTGLELEKISPKGSTNAEHLKNAPSPVITVAGEETFAAIVVDTKTNTLYKYDKNGKPEIVYSVATGKKYTPTRKGIRQIDHTEDYPYKEAYGTKRKKNPKAYGPNVLYLVTIDTKTGEDLGSNGQLIHGNNEEKSLGSHASLGCVRMDNEVITKLAKEVEEGSYVLIQ